jgi:hypothetical protein
MPEPKRKFESEVLAVPSLKLEPKAKLKKNHYHPPLRKRQKETSFTHEIIYGIIEKIKDL